MSKPDPAKIPGARSLTLASLIQTELPFKAEWLKSRLYFTMCFKSAFLINDQGRQTLHQTIV